jgi:hypothetical protein
MEAGETVVIGVVAYITSGIGEAEAEAVDVVTATIIDVVDGVDIESGAGGVSMEACTPSSEAAVGE